MADSRALPLRDAIEAGFGTWARWAMAHAAIVLVGCSLVVTGLLLQLPRLEIDISDEGFLRPGDPVRVAYNAFNRQFGDGQAVIVAIEPPEIFDVAFLEWLTDFHRDMEEVAQLEKVTSLINARNTFGRDDELVVEDLLETIPTTPAELAALRERVLANPLYLNALISVDGSATVLVAKFDRYSSLADGTAGDDVLAGFGEEGAEEFRTQEETMKIADEVNLVIERHRVEGYEMFVTGGPIFDAWIFCQMQDDILVSIVSSSFVIALLLFVLFRRISGVLIPLVLVALSLLCSGGTMALLGIPVTLPIQVLPSFLLAVGVCGAVHILVLVYRGLDRGQCSEDAVAYAMAHTGLPVFMAGLTTAGGLLSFSTAELAPVGHFGIVGPIGVMFTIFFTLVALPPLIGLLRLKGRGRLSDLEARGLSDRVLAAAGRLAIQRPKIVVAVGVGLVALALAGITQLRFSHHPVDWIPDESPLHEALDYVNDRMGGSGDLQILLRTPGVENGFQDPDVLVRLDRLKTVLLDLKVDGLETSHVTSIADIVKETHQALNENRTEFYVIPENPELTAQELLLFENSGSEDLADFVDSQFSMASFSIRIPWVDSVDTLGFIDAVEARAFEIVGDKVEVVLTGGTVIFSRIMTAVIYSMAQSYLLALAIITPMMILMIGDLRGGLLSMIPNLFPIILTLGLMGWCDFPLDFSSMMIGAIVLGIAVDDTIHFMHVFQRNYRMTGDPKIAVTDTLVTTGRAILFTSIVLCVGFSGFMLATMENLVATGVLTCFAIAAAFVADILLAPAIAVLVMPKREKPLISA